MGQSRMDNPETSTNLDTRHRTKAKLITENEKR
jgi:hypothetical protein